MYKDFHSVHETMGAKMMFGSVFGFPYSPT